MAIPPSSVPTLEVTEPSGRRVAHPVQPGSSIVGRDRDAQWVVLSDQVSRRHAEIHREGRRLRLRDLGSRNGTTVNGELVRGWTDLADGDVIRFDDPPDFATGPTRPTERTGLPASRIPVFVSHSSADKSTVRALARFLQARGWQIWIDEAGIAGGKQWHGELIRAPEATWVVLLVVSHHSMRSRWVIREVQAAGRLGLPIIPVAVEDMPYPDELRMILSGVQRLDISDRHDADRWRSELARVDEALEHAARSRRPTSRPGRSLIVAGTVIAAVGLVGFLAGFALFAYLGFSTVTTFSTGDDVASPFLGWGVCVVSIVVAGVGEAVRRAGRRKGI